MPSKKHTTKGAAKNSAAYAAKIKLKEHHRAMQAFEKIYYANAQQSTEKIQKSMEDLVDLSHTLLQSHRKLTPLESFVDNVVQKIVDLQQNVEFEFSEDSTAYAQDADSFLISRQDAIAVLESLLQSEIAQLSPTEHAQFQKGFSLSTETEENAALKLEQDDEQEEEQDDEQDEQEEQDDDQPYTYDVNRQFLLDDLLTCQRTLSQQRHIIAETMDIYPRLQAACQDANAWRSLLEQHWHAATASMQQIAEQIKTNPDAVVDDDSDLYVDTLRNLVIETLTLLLLPTTESLRHRSLASRLFSNADLLSILPTQAELYAEDNADVYVDSDVKVHDDVDNHDDILDTASQEAESFVDQTRQIRTRDDVRTLAKILLDVIQASHEPTKAIIEAHRQYLHDRDADDTDDASDLDENRESHDNKTKKPSKALRDTSKFLEKIDADLRLMQTQYTAVQTFFRMRDAAQQDLAQWQQEASAYWHLARSTGNGMTLPTALQAILSTTKSAIFSVHKINLFDVVIDDTLALDTLQQLTLESAPVFQQCSMAWRTRELLDLIKQGRTRGALRALKSQRQLPLSH